MKQILTTLAFAATLVLQYTPAQAAWGDFYCDITEGAASTGWAFETAVSNYNDDGQCRNAVRFMDSMTVPLPNGLTISTLPPNGNTYGFAIRKCVMNGAYQEPDCTAAGDTDVVLDFSDFTEDGGKCPIKVVEGAKINIIRVKMIVPDPDFAVCTLEGDALSIEELSDPANPYVWLNQVKVCSSAYPNCVELAVAPKVEIKKIIDWSSILKGLR